MTTYRNNGAIGALLDQYERAVQDLKATIQNISTAEMLTVADPYTQDEDCRSIQSVLTHVVRAGYWYTQEIRHWLGEEKGPRRHQLYQTNAEYIAALDQMTLANVQLFADYPDLALEEKSTENKMLVSWGQRYDVEQLMEHAIVHVLRHRRQIERFLLALRP